MKIEEKQLIGCNSDVHQLFPIKYDWAWESYLTSCANHWMPMEIDMSADVALWKSNKLTKDERTIIKRTLGFFSTADALVANNLVLAVYRHLTNPEARMYLLQQAHEEAIHQHAYHHIIETLGLDQEELFGMYNTIESVKAKAEWALYFTSALETQLLMPIDLLEALVAFYIVFEGIFFYAGFAQIFELGRRGLMTGTCEQLQYILRDETMHMLFGVQVINEIQTNYLQDEGIKDILNRVIDEGIELELVFAKEILQKKSEHLSYKQFKAYLMWVADDRKSQIGLKTRNRRKNPLGWFGEEVGLIKEKNFFETRVIDYKTGGSLKWT